MRVGIVGIQNLKHMTTVSVYTDILDKYNIDYDIIYMDKYGIEEKSNAKCLYRYEMKDKKPGLIGKVLESVRFHHFATKVLKEEKYDFLILWREYAVFLFSFFSFRHYRRRYSINIRDLWSKKNIPVTLGVNKALKGSAFNTVCSDGFIPHLPKAEYIFLHCINYEASKSIKKMLADRVELENNQGPISIVYIGTLRFEEYCCRLVDLFANDSRFIIKFIGQGSEKIEAYANSKGYGNVICSGAFNPDQTAELIFGADIINCAYGVASDAEKALLPTRFYYAIDMGVPVITSEGSWVDKKAKELGIGITIPSDLKDKLGIADKVYTEYKKMDRESIISKTAAYRNEIDITIKEFEDKFMNVLGLEKIQNTRKG